MIKINIIDMILKIKWSGPLRYTTSGIFSQYNSNGFIIWLVSNDLL